MMKFLRRIPGYWVVIGIAIIAAFPLWQSGFLNTKAAGETPYLLARVQQMSVALKDGVFPVRWMPDGAYGLGYPFFNFYAAFPYYVASLLHLLGFGIVSSLKITHTLGFVSGGLGMYFWMRRHLRTESAAILAAATFTFAPMHMVNIYVRGDSLSEFWAMGMFPVVLWAIDRIINRPRPGSIALLGIVGASVILSHNISAMIFLPLSAVYGLWMLIPKFRWQKFGALAAGGLLAVLLSTWFWLPALAERDTVQTDGRMTEGYFYWGNNFLDEQLVQSDWAIDYASFPPGLGLWQTLLVGSGIVGALVLLARRKKPPSRMMMWALLVFGLSVILTQSFSSPAYETFGVLAYLQFTWRWLTLTAISAAAIAAYTVDGWDSERWRRVLTGILVVITVVGGLIRLDLEFMPISESDITAERLAEREFYSGDIGTTVTTEYLPAGMNPRIFSGPIIVGSRDLKVLDGMASGELVGRESTREQWRVDVISEQATVAVPTLYWPGWAAELDNDIQLAVSPIEGIMWLQVQIPQGIHTLTFALHDTQMRWASNLVSLLSVFVVGALGWRSFRGISWHYEKRHATLYGVPVIVAATLVLLGVQSSAGLPQGPQATQFWRNSYRHAYADGLVFSDGARLLDYQYPEEIYADETLNIVLNWEEEITSTIELIPPLVNLWNVDAALAVGTGIGRVSLDIPVDAAPGLYFVRLIHNGEIYDLTPVRILQGDAVSSFETSIADFGDRLRLTGVRTSALNKGRLNFHLSWQVLQAVTENYSLALRFYSPSGQPLAAYDGPLGVYGGTPPVYWDEYFTDWVTLTGLDGLPPGEGYRLMVTIYTPDGALDNTMIHDLVIQESPQQQEQDIAELIGDIILQSEQGEQGASLPVECHWQGVVEADWAIEWSFDDEYRVTTSLTPGARLDWWRPDQRYQALVSVPIPLELEPGTYTLHWRIIDADGEEITPSPEVGQVEILPTSRTFMPLDAQRLATFGSIQLLDYALNRKGDSLTIDFIWGLSEQMQSNYTLFVHILDPEDNRVVAQTDTMPRAGLYPVTAWITGEMVEDTVLVDLTRVISGEYVVAVGWYDPLNPSERLLALAADGTQLVDDRFELAARITVP